MSFSDNENDCFLFFSNHIEPRGYIAVTQWQMFNEFYKTIFGQLVKFNGNRPRIADELVQFDAFPQYAKRSEVQKFMDEFETKVETLESNLDDYIVALRRKGVLDYGGATEIQAIGEDAIPALVKYHNFAKATGQIWCQAEGSTPPESAEDWSEIGT